MTSASHQLDFLKSIISTFCISTMFMAFSMYLEKSKVFAAIDGDSLVSYAEEQRLECISELKTEYERLLGPVVEGKNAILVDMVAHGNLGDSFIQHGEQIFLRFKGSYPKLHCSINQCDWSAVNRSIVENAPSLLLIHGGGNFGDVWPSMEEFHRSIVKGFPSTPIVFLPQSVHYKYLRNAVKDAELFGKHPDIRYYVRDLHSLSYLRTHFKDHPTELCPDAAFLIPPFKSSMCKPVYDVLIISRRDPEKAEGARFVLRATEYLKKLNISFSLSDWPNVPRSLQKYRFSLDRPELLTKFGKDFVCQGRVIVTDRLHAVLMSTLIGLPHVYVDNTYGKIERLRSSFFRQRPACQDTYLQAQRAKTWHMALQMAALKLESL